MAISAARDANRVPALIGVSSSDGVTPVAAYIDPTTHRLYADVVVSSATVVGAKSNNAAVPGATNLGTLPGVATAAAPTYTEGFQVGLSTDLAGALRITGTVTANATTDNSAFTASTSTGTTAFGFYHSTIDAVTDGRAAALAIDSKRNLFNVIRDAAGNARGANVDANNNLGVVLAAETTKVLGTTRTLGNAGAIFDGVNTAATAPANGILTLGIYNSTEPSPTTGQSVGTQVDAKGRARQVIMDAAGNTRGANVDANNNLGVVLAAETTKVIGTINLSAAQTLATVTTVSTVTNLAQMNGAALLMGNGTTGTGSQRVTIASDNTAFTVNPASATAPVSTMNSASANSGVTSPIAAVFDDVAPTAITENSFGFLRMSANRNQYTTIRDAAGNERGVNVDASNRMSVTVDAFTATNASVNVAQMNGVATTMGNGVAGTGVQRVAIASDNSAVAGVGAAATGAAVPANAVYKGGIAKTANPSAATDGNLVGSLHDKLGKQVVVGSIRDLKGNQKTTITSSTSETTIATAVASTFLDLYGLVIANSSATACNVTIKDSTAGTTRFIIAVPAGETRGFMLNESAAHNQATVNTNWTATCSASVASIEITALFVKNT